MDMESFETREDLKLPEGEIGDAVRKAFEDDESGVLVSYSLLFSFIRRAHSMQMLTGRRDRFAVRGEECFKYAIYLVESFSPTGGPLLHMGFGLRSYPKRFA